MKRLRSVIVILLTLAMLLPMGQAYANENEQDKPKNEVSCSVRDDEAFEISYLFKKGTSGQYDFGSLSSTKEMSLDGLEVIVDTSEFAIGPENSVSVLWTQEPLADSKNHVRSGTDIYYHLGGSELSAMLGWGNGGLGITVKNTHYDENEKLIASEVSIVYFDPERKNEIIYRGTEYSFPSLDLGYPIRSTYENIDISEGIRFYVRADEALGYVVEINGKEYGDAESEIYPYWAVDLNRLSEFETGYVTVGGVVYSEGIEETKKLTIESVNGESAVTWAENGEWSLEYELCDHELTEKPIENTEDFCEPPKYFVCEKCGYEEIWPGSKVHNIHRTVVTVDPTFESEGEEITFCTDCKRVWMTNAVPKLDIEDIARYKDVDANAWYSCAVAWCSNTTIFNGTSENTFEPSAVLTREQFAVILARMSAVPTHIYENKDSGMEDVPTGKWYSGAVAWGVEKGYIKGIGNGKFGLGQAMDRASVVTLLFRYMLDNTTSDVITAADLSGYSDHEDVPEWAREGMGWAVANRIIEGTDKNEKLLSPDMTLTRAQAAKIIMRYYYND